MEGKRASGILLHPTSLPGPYGIGDLGQAAYDFVDFLVETEQSCWQMLPLGPTTFGDSPYQSTSTFAGNPLMLSFDRIREQGLLATEDLLDVPDFPRNRVDYKRLYHWKYPLLRKAYRNFKNAPHPQLNEAFRAFCEREAWWVNDYAFYSALKDAHGGQVWDKWEPEIAQRRQDAMHEWGTNLAVEIETYKFWQYLFDVQWKSLKQVCQKNQIELIGDIPIYTAYDSSDVWANPHLFYLDERGRPTIVAGVPPDYFSESGQLWGNPIYNWEIMKHDGYAWWIKRFQKLLEHVDVVRLDHFRGIEAYWAVPAGEETAINGNWETGPGEHILEAIRNALGGLPIIAENLGLITEEVEDLRNRFNLPGMSVLHFAFDPDSMDSEYLPHKYIRNLVAYTGTHDNDTTQGWWQEMEANGSQRDAEYVRREREFASKYLDVRDRPIHWVCIRAIMASVANVAIFPLQDVLGLGAEARMNVPGKPTGNWQWRYTQDQITPEIHEQLREMTLLYGRGKQRNSQ